MSTEHQKYSTENQSEAMAKYAVNRSIEIVRTYADEGKSGLRLDGRASLRRLIDDVEAGNVDFTEILVYDVSRWGRFQNADESAYLEYICTRAGLTVHYCAEQFENDGSIAATVIKSMKRAMAGEYSRELSAKVFAGQCRLITLGFRQGGMAGYGLRRRLVDEHGQRKGELRIGEQKSIQTDRVILVPGPDYEVRTVRRMYRMFVERGATEREIASRLNAEGGFTDLGRPWTRGTVHQVLTNEKYVGDNVFNRISFKLKKRRVRNTADQIVRATGAFEPLVDRSLFEAARQIIAARSVRYSDDDMLARLTRVLEQSGYLSALTIDERDDVPSSSAYRSRFGSLLRAYELIGYSPGRDYRYVEINRFLRKLHSDVVEQTIANIRAQGSTVFKHPITELLTINGEVTVSIVVSRCLETPAGSRRWKVRLDTGLQPDISVVLRMGPDNREAQDYYLLPRVDFDGQRVRMVEENGFHLDAYRFESLDPFFFLMSRVQIRRTA